MKIYTRTGDDGETSLFAGPRVQKDDARIEAYGTVDELNAVLGMVLATGVPEQLYDLARQIQHDLFSLGAQLATPNPEKHGTALVTADRIAFLEQAIDEHDAQLPALQTFILPGGTPAAAALHMARTVCRRAERHVVSLIRNAPEHLSQEPLIYLNRLSDLLFVLARRANQLGGKSDPLWQKPASM